MAPDLLGWTQLRFSSAAKQITITMKKPVSKPAAASVPAKKTVAKPVPKAAPVKKMPALPATKPSLAKPAAKSKAAAKPGPTIITAHIDIGFGNALHLRGDGPGLSWHQGVPLECVADDEWTLTLPEK